MQRVCCFFSVRYVVLVLDKVLDPTDGWNGDRKGTPQELKAPLYLQQLVAGLKRVMKKWARRKKAAEAARQNRHLRHAFTGCGKSDVLSFYWACRGCFG